MKVLGSIEWRAVSSGCREVVRLQVHTGWRMERMRESASEIACSSALKMLALFGSLVVLVTFP